MTNSPSSTVPAGLCSNSVRGSTTRPRHLTSGFRRRPRSGWPTPTRSRWPEQEFPAIRKQAKAEGATVFFADEAGLRSDYHAGTTWAPVGATPVVKATGAVTA